MRIDRRISREEGEWCGRECGERGWWRQNVVGRTAVDQYGIEAKAHAVKQKSLEEAAEGKKEGMRQSEGRRGGIGERKFRGAEVTAHSRNEDVGSLNGVLFLLVIRAFGGVLSTLQSVSWAYPGGQRLFGDDGSLASHRVAQVGCEYTLSTDRERVGAEIEDVAGTELEIEEDEEVEDDEDEDKDDEDEVEEDEDEVEEEEDEVEEDEAEVSEEREEERDTE
ncbi:hypothetical protein P7C73_g6256, partial [Tremellales sp. Uapishka_1]